MMVQELQPLSWG